MGIRRYALLTLALAACTSDGSTAPDMAAPPSFCDGPNDGGASRTAVEAMLAANCALSGCHDGQPGQAWVGLDLRPGHARASLVGVTSAEHDGGCGTRVVPGDAGASYAYHKLVDDMPCDGLQMPRCEDGSCPLPSCAADLLRRWIEAGAN